MHHGPRRRLPRLPHAAGPVPTDAELLARFAAGRDEAAFELLLRRHAPMVLGVCRRLLRDPNDADDAFQAAFLVLARKAGSLARGEALAGWLHRVACRAALRLRTDRARRVNPMETDVEQLTAPATDDPELRELARVLDEEVGRLPARHRIVFILCCLEGKTGEEAGRLLGCPAGTVSSRLTRARERLRDRLTRRGFAPAAVASAVLTGDALAAFPPAALVDSTLLAALAFAAGWPPGEPPTRPAAVAEGVLRAMTTTRLKLAAGLLALGLLTAGAVVAGTGPGPHPAAEPGVEPNQPQPQAKAADERPIPVVPAAPVVQLVRPQPGGLERVTTQLGTAEPVQQADLYPAVAGSLKSVSANLGDKVKAGQVLAEIDAPDVILDVQQARVGVAQARGLITEAEARVKTAKAEFEAAKGMVKQREAELAAAQANLALRQKQLDRIKALYAQKAVGEDVLAEHEAQYLAAKAQMDGALAAVENAKADLEVKKGKLEQAEAAAATARVNVEAAEVPLQKAQLALAQTKIISPIDGIVANLNWRPGDFVRPGDNTRRQPLFTIMRTDTIVVVVSLPESDIPHAQPGVPAELEFGALPGTRVTGKLARVGFAVDPTTQTVRAEIVVPNPEQKLRPGMAGRVTLRFGKGPADAVRVPAIAVVRRNDGAEGTMTGVYVYRDGKARLTPVRVGYSNSREAEIVSGLKADDRVVADPAGLEGAEVPVAVEPPKK